jgi:isocitrate/isopropylmalate dehydrogenase
MLRVGLGLKAATITPEGAGDVGSPNRLLREAIGGKVIVRTGRRLPGVTTIAGVHHPIAIIRMAVGDAYGAEQWRERTDGDELAHRTETIRRSDCRAVAEYAFREAERMGGRVFGGPKWTVSPIYEGMLKEELDAAAKRHPKVPYQPLLIDATLAGLVSGAAGDPLAIPCLNRDGDLLSDLVLPMFGSIAGAESVLLALDPELRVRVAMAEAPHGTAPALQGKDVANPMAMILAAAAVLKYAHGESAEAARAASDAIRGAVIATAAAGIRTPDLGGHAGTNEFTDEVIARTRGVQRGDPG